MPAGRVCMRHVREILRLTGSGVSKREIARRLGVVPSTVRETLRRFGDAQLSWPLAAAKNSSSIMPAIRCRWLSTG